MHPLKLFHFFSLVFIITPAPPAGDKSSPLLTPIIFSTLPIRPLGLLRVFPSLDTLYPLEIVKFLPHGAHTTLGRPLFDLGAIAFAWSPSISTRVSISIPGTHYLSPGAYFRPLEPITCSHLPILPPAPLICLIVLPVSPPPGFPRLACVRVT